MGETRTMNSSINIKKNIKCTNCNSDNHKTTSCPRKTFKPKLIKKRKRIVFENDSAIDFYSDLMD